MANIPEMMSVLLIDNHNANISNLVVLQVSAP